MFTGIIETVGKVVSIQADNTNLSFRIRSTISNRSQIEQTSSNNGVCLTGVSTQAGEHMVTAVAETLTKSNIGLLKVNDEITLERCTKIGTRRDGPIGQGHVAQTA